jgi:hypothetical protein
MKPKFTFKSEAVWIWILAVAPLLLGLILVMIFWLAERMLEF